MSDDAEDTLIRQRRVLETSEDEKVENQDDCESESESESEKEKEIGILNNNSNEQTEKDSNVDKDQSEKEPVKDNGNGCISPKGTQKTPESSPILTPRVFRGIQPRPPPSFISRQVTNAKNFLIELFEFIMLFITTLVHPLADVNSQVNAYHQRREARRQAGFGPQQRPTRFPYPGCGSCGPSS